MITSFLERTDYTDHAAGRTATATTSCQVYAGSLLAPCQNAATVVVVRRGAEREVCAAHA